MTSGSPTARLDIDLSALSHNYAALKRRAGGAEVAPVVKADAYGLGLPAIARRLAQDGARSFFTARLAEALSLRTVLGSDATIYVLDGLTDPNAFAAHRLRPVLNTAEQYQLWIQGSADVIAALHIDTGMNRLGIRPEEVARLPSCDSHHLAMAMSHLACADEAGHPLNAQQLTMFRDVSRQFAGSTRSLANSAGIFLGPDYGFDLVRPGISLYGGGPEGKPHPDIRPVAHLSAKVLQVRTVSRGESVGYGATFVAGNEMRLATVGLGYADGLLRSFGASGFATIEGHRRPLVGRISMDVFSVDVTGIDVGPGNWVEVLGHAQRLDDVAEAAGTISYEVLTRLGSRIIRHYR